MKVIIAGMRDYFDPQPVAEAMAKFMEPGIVVDEIVSGGATGVDALGERWAKEHGIPVQVFPADWNKHGKSAGPIRNQQMAEYADALVAIWNGVSKGTQNMISTMRKLNKFTTVWRV